MTSFRDMRIVPAQTIQDRLETVKPLSENDLELYEIAKDRETGDHYVHYSYAHIDVAVSTEKQSFHQLLPITSDDVLGIMFSDQSYAYPQSWKEPFLRNGPDGGYVWFDPGYAEDEQASEEIGEKLGDLLSRFKEKGQLDEQQVRKLLDDLDRLGGQ